MDKEENNAGTDEAQEKRRDPEMAPAEAVPSESPRKTSWLEHTSKYLSEIRKPKRTRVMSPEEVAASHPGKTLVLRRDGDIPREIPVRLGRYIIDGLIGRGGMGVVYKARQDGLDRVVALKLLLQGEHASPEGLGRFEREARAIAKLKHPNIVAIHEVGEYNGQPFFTMDFIDGVPLGKFIKRVPIESQ
jgi:serine/threonine protein kinase